MIPRNEQETIALFSSLAQALGYKFKSIGMTCPDAILVKNGVDVRVEFEHKAKNFVNHKHDPNDVDLIICWENDWPGSPVPVLSLENYTTLTKPTPRWQRFLAWLRDYQTLASQYAQEIKIARTKNSRRLVCSLCGGKITVKCTYSEERFEKDSGIRFFGSIHYTCTNCGHHEIKDAKIYW